MDEPCDHLDDACDHLDNAASIPVATYSCGLSDYYMESFSYFSAGECWRGRCVYCPYVTNFKGYTDLDAFKAIRDHLRDKHRIEVEKPAWLSCTT